MLAIESPVSDTATTRPEPGVYRNVPWKEYHAWAVCSSHALGVLAEQSPAHLQYLRSHPEPTTPALLMGQALHTRILEPELFSSHFAVADTCCAILKSGQNKGATCGKSASLRVGSDWYCGTHAPTDAEEPENCLSVAQLDGVMAMEQSLIEHAAAYKVIHAASECELSIVWDQPVPMDDGSVYSLRCKMRADMIVPAFRLVADLKTSDDASPKGFQRSVANYGYHRQAAHYLAGLRASGFSTIEDFAFLAVEKSLPCAVGAYRLRPDQIDAAMVELRPLYRTYAACERSGVWPAYHSMFQDIALPDWKLRQIENQL